MLRAKSTGRRLERDKELRELKKKKKKGEKSKDYRQGFIDGYAKAIKDSNRIRKETEKRMKYSHTLKG